MNNMTFVSLAYHRNGVGGEGFWAIAFDFRSLPRTRRMLAVVFEGLGIDRTLGEVHPCIGRVAVLDPALASAGIVGGPDNRWRGDDFEPTLRQWIAVHGPEYFAKLAIPAALPAPQTA